MIVSVIGTLAGSQFGLLGGQGWGAPLPFPGWAMPMIQVAKNNKVNKIEKILTLIPTRIMLQFTK
jgi:hypothetical protein